MLQIIFYVAKTNNYESRLGISNTYLKAKDSLFWTECRDSVTVPRYLESRRFFI